VTFVRRRVRGKWVCEISISFDMPKGRSYAPVDLLSRTSLKVARAFTLDPKDQSKISLKILHFPLPVG
jgi:hypothetical protein